MKWLNRVAITLTIIGAIGTAVAMEMGLRGIHYCDTCNAWTQHRVVWEDHTVFADKYLIRCENCGTTKGKVR